MERVKTMYYIHRTYLWKNLFLPHGLLPFAETLLLADAALLLAAAGQFFSTRDDASYVKTQLFA